jgi:hypothetical protein
MTDPRSPGFFARREEVMADLEGAEQAEAAVAAIDHRQSAHAFLIDQLEGVIDRRIGTNGDDVRLHHVADARREIVDQHRRLDAKFLQHEIDALVGMARTCGEGVRITGETLQFRVSKRGADGIHVGIPVADDDGLHWRGGCTAPTGAASGATRSPKAVMSGKRELEEPVFGCGRPGRCCG